MCIYIMNVLIICFAFLCVSAGTNVICKAFVLDTNLAKFIRNTTSNVDVGRSSAEDSRQYAYYRKLSTDAVVSAFNGFVRIVDDPMFIKRSTMNYDIPDVVRSEGFIEELSVRHLKKTILNQVFISDNDSYVQLELTFPSLFIAGWYNMTLHFDRHSISVYGNGSFAVQLYDYKIRLNITLQKAKEGYTVPNNIACNQTLGGVNVKINNLLEDPRFSEAFSENLSAIIPALHTSYKHVIDQFMGQALMIYGKMLFLNSKPGGGGGSSSSVNLETMIRAFAKQATDN